MKKRLLAAVIAAVMTIAGFSIEVMAQDDYIYCVGSVSKVYAAAAVMKLADEGKVDPDGFVTDYIPDFKLSDERYKDITVRMLMDHTSGIMGTTQTGAFSYEDNNIRQNSFLDVLSKQRLKADPGEYAAYCNDGFDLLALIVENVTGMTFTEYVEKEIAAPTGGTATGTAKNYETLGTPAPAFTPGNLHMDFGVTLALGAGGVYSKASDVADFGAAFFKGSEILLSEKAKNEMVVRWDALKGSDPFKDNCGLAWDDVQVPGFEDAGVQVLIKGGDSGMNHAVLTVAPEEEISVSVLSNGGSSALNGMMAQALLETVLEERGITLPEKEEPEYRISSVIPSEYDEFEGYYSSSDLSGSAVIDHITFPDHRYMHVESIGPLKTTCTDYMLIDDGAEPGRGRFAELAYELETEDETSFDEVLGGAHVAVNPVVISFVRDDKGGVFFTIGYDEVFSDLGRIEKKKYGGQMMKENPVDEETLKAWEDAFSEDLLVCDDDPSSTSYDNGTAYGALSKEMPGYVYASLGQWGTRILKIMDKEHAVAFQTIPSSSNRDCTDVTIISDEDGTKLALSTGLKYISAKDITVFDTTLREDELFTGKASWYRIGDDCKDQSFKVERPEGGHIYVYNKYGSVVYNTHVKDASDDIPLPADGYIVFLSKQSC
ncbi:MAG: beta-lactamase family protein [Lachnospiraceae bacterium]|nr:beta-lactamase family protein [Lachnospiraceae bacterium]